MRVIIIEEKDALALLDQLELVKLNKHHIGRLEPEKPPTAEEMHRAFHYVVTRWLQDQGAACVR